MLWYLKNRDRKHAWIESALAALFVLWFVACAVFRLSWSFVGIGAMAWAFVIVISMAVRNGEIRFLSYLGALLFILLYVFGVKMHERYLFPAFALLMFAWVLQRDRRILYLLILFSSTVFINEGVVLDNSIRLGSALGHLNNDTTVLADILSVLNVLGAVLSVLLGYALMKGKLPGDVKQLPSFLPIRKVSGKIGSKKAPDRKLHWNKKDTVILLCITALFTVLTLTTLGSTKAPQTAWTSSGEEEQVTFDLGKTSKSRQAPTAKAGRIPSGPRWTRASAGNGNMSPSPGKTAPAAAPSITTRITSGVSPAAMSASPPARWDLP